MSDTPRTDEISFTRSNYDSAWMAFGEMVSFARQLERELAAAQQRIAALEQCIASTADQLGDPIGGEYLRLEEAASELVTKLAAAKDAEEANLHIIAEMSRNMADLQMQMDSSCNAEELRQVRAERDALREDKERLDWLEDHRTAHPAADEPQEWVTQDEHEDIAVYDSTDDGYAGRLERLLTRKFGKPSELVSKRELAAVKAERDALRQQLEEANESHALTRKAWKAAIAIDAAKGGAK